MKNGELPMALTKHSLVVQEFPGEVLVYDAELHKAYHLNSTAAFVWKHCDGMNDADEIARLLEQELKVDSGYKQVQTALWHLRKCRLLY
jgi:hypothetical protein